MSPPDVSFASRARLGAYFGLLMLTLGLAEPTGLVSLPILFWLKNGLGLGPQSVAGYEALVVVPTYFGFAFGFLRDRWKPFGRDDRAYFFLVAPIAIWMYCWVASDTLTLPKLVLAMFVASAALECMHATAEALVTAAAQRHGMTGRLSALSEVAEVVPSVISMLVGGWMASHVTPRTALFAAAAVTAAVVLQSLGRSRAVTPLPSAHDGEESAQAVRRLLRHRALWPAMAALVLWNFSPGFGTALLFYLSDTVKVSTQMYGAYGAVFFVSAAMSAVFYAVLCRRYALGRMLRWILALNLLPSFLLLAANTGVQALGIAAIIGLLLGMGNIALFDLLRRSCPARLEGSGFMLGYSVFAFSGTIGDLAGSWLYQHSGLLACLTVDAAATAAVFFVLPRVPHAMLFLRDGEVRTSETITAEHALAAL